MFKDGFHGDCSEIYLVGLILINSVQGRIPWRLLRDVSSTLNIDITVFKDGFHGDFSDTYLVRLILI